MTNIENDQDETFRRYMAEHAAAQTRLLEKIAQNTGVVKVLAIILLVLLVLSFFGALVNALSY